MENSLHKSGFVNVNGIRLHYLDWGGSGPALLFLAGMGCNAHIFNRFAPRFTDKFHTLALTRRGHGESDYPETGYDIDFYRITLQIFCGRNYSMNEVKNPIHPERWGLALVHLESLIQDHNQ
jgi:pimeloyl-ACP methyl ester carboxylesterase